ncbi:MFS transporter [Pseudonocardia sp. NPDC049154]|uniref:MFS transporter n=1 Tax=Pseudonocardia sp. NPDC049154 TaxID=3155501 RepID=UPI0033E10255
MSAHGSTAPGTSPRRLAAATFIGTMVEFYDFALYASAAALVFPTVFFPEASTSTGLLLSFATFGVGFVARPVGALVFGHFGDRLGRRRMLALSIMLMGGASVLMGALPGYAQIGVLAPLLLVVLRLVQGAAVGGEWGGAALMAVEHAPPGRRGLYGAFPIAGGGGGSALASGAMLLAAQLPEDQFLSWGWRIPFLASAVLVLIGIVIRLRIAESPAFVRLKTARAVVRVPVVEAFRRQWRRILLGVFLYLSQGTFTYIFLVYVVSYATTQVGIARPAVLTGTTIASVLSIGTYLLGGMLSDRIGRKAAYLSGVVATAALAWPAFALVNAGRPALFALAIVLIITLALAPMAGVTGTLFTVLFDTDIRYTGTSISYTLAQLTASAFAPSIAAALFAATGTSLSIVGYLLVVSVISLVAVFLVPGRFGRGAALAQDAEEGGRRPTGPVAV